jgi:hypothetical protein
MQEESVVGDKYWLFTTNTVNMVQSVHLEIMKNLYASQMCYSEALPTYR